MTPDSIVADIAPYVIKLISNGGPSVVRWVFLATATTITLSWCLLLGSLIVGYFVFGHTDTGLVSAVISIATILTGFASYATNTKTVTDAQAASANPSKADIGVVSSQVSSGKQND